MRRLRRGLAAPGLALLLALGAGAELRRVEAVGVVPVGSGAPTRPREQALARALAEAVRRVALEELGGAEGLVPEGGLAPAGRPPGDPGLAPGSADGGGSELLARVDATLGDRPLDYATRYRVVEDRGLRAAIFSQDPEIEREYVVVAEVYVDSDRVRSRLVDGGLLAPTPSGESPLQRVTVVIEELQSYRDLQTLRAILLEGLGARSVVAREFEPGRAVLEVQGDRAAAELQRALLGRAPEELRIEPRGIAEETLTLRLIPTAAPVPPAPDAPGPAAIDTLRRKRY